MDSQNGQKFFISIWKLAKLLWLAQALANLSFGIPLVAMTLFAADIPSPVIWRTVIFYFMISFFVFVPFNGTLAFIFFKPIPKILNRDYKKKEAATEEKAKAFEIFFTSPFYFSFFTFISFFLGFTLGLFILQLGAIPGLMDLIVIITILGLAVGFVTCLIQSSLIYIFLENYSRPLIEILNRFHPDLIKKIKIIKFPIFWKIFLLALSSIIVAQVSLGALYLGRIAIEATNSRFLFTEDLKKAFIYVGVVLASTLFYIIIIAISSSKNLVGPIGKIISWADKITKGETKEEIFLTTNDEVASLVGYLKKMYQEIEETKASLEIKIKARTKELEELAGKREEIIEERVKEIRKRTEELEKFQKIAVGRELKMVELKKEISKLKELQAKRQNKLKN